MRLIVAIKEKGARTKTLGHALKKNMLTYNPYEGTTLLKFVYGHLYNVKLAMRYGHTPTDEWPLCHMPDSCTHIAGECPDHEALRISRHNAACQLIHADIRKNAKGGGALHSASGLVLVITDTDTQPMTTGDSTESLSSTAEETNLSPPKETPPPPTTGSDPCPCRRRSAVGATPMSPNVPYTTSEISPPLPGTHSAPRHPAAYHIGLSP